MRPLDRRRMSRAFKTAASSLEASSGYSQNKPGVSISRMDFPAAFTTTSWGYIVVDGVCIGLLDSLYTGQESLRDRAFIMELFPTFMTRLLGEMKLRKTETHVRCTDNRDDEVFALLRCPFTEEFEDCGNSECVLNRLRPISRSREYQCWK